MISTTKSKKKSEGVKEKEEAICDNIENIYDKKCSNNMKLLEAEEKNRSEFAKEPIDSPLEPAINEKGFLYPHLDDPNFNMKIALKTIPNMTALFTTSKNMPTF